MLSATDRLRLTTVDAARDHGITLLLGDPIELLKDLSQYKENNQIG